MMARHLSGGWKPRAGPRALLAAATLLVALLPLLAPPAMASRADVAVRLPWAAGLHLDLHPMAWSADQVARTHHRALLQALAAGGSAGTAGAAGSELELPSTDSSAAPFSQQLPVCELNLGYRIVDVGNSNFTSIVTLTNNREVRLGGEVPLLKQPWPGQ